MEKLTPKKMVPHLMKVLATRSEPNKLFNTDEIVADFCAYYGMKETDWGLVESQATKPTWVRYQTIRTLRAIKKEGLIVSPERGKYRFICNAKTVVTTKEVVVETSAELDEARSKLLGLLVAFADSKPAESGGLSWNPIFMPMLKPHKEERVVKLLVEQTRCFGWYSTKAPTCKECPLRALCQREAIEALDGIAKELEKPQIALPFGFDPHP